MELGRKFAEKPILLFTRDDEVVEISTNREQLKQYYRFLLPDDHIVQMLMEKVKFAQYADTKKLLIPKTELINDISGLLTIDSRIPFPIIIKPYLMHSIKVDDQTGVIKLSQKLGPINYQSMVAQEYIEGNDDQLYFCFLLYDKEGKLVRSMYARKLRQWPVSYGTTSLAITVEDPRLAHAVEQFTTAIDMRGFCSIEFKYDASKDRFLIMEPTVGRFNQQIALTVASGVNFPAAMVDLLSGNTLENQKQVNGILWIYESNDLLSFLKSKRKYGYFNNFFKRHVSVLFDSKDPAPAWWEIKDLAKKKFKKIFRHV